MHGGSRTLVVRSLLGCPVRDRSSNTIVRQMIGSAYAGYPLFVFGHKKST